MTTEPVDNPNAMPAPNPINDKKNGATKAKASKRHFFHGIGVKVSAAVKPISNKKRISDKALKSVHIIFILSIPNLESGKKNQSTSS